MLARELSALEIDAARVEWVEQSETHQTNTRAMSGSTAKHPEPAPPDNRLFNDALRFGEEISEDEYLSGK